LDIAGLRIFKAGGLHQHGGERLCRRRSLLWRRYQEHGRIERYAQLTRADR